MDSLKAAEFRASHRTALIGAALLLVGQALLLASGATANSPAMDDTAHLAAGLSHWELGRYDLFKVNPPLVRMIAALPAIAAKPSTDWEDYFAGIGSRPEFAVMDHFTRANGPRVVWLATLARWGLIPLALSGAYVCLRWARELYGNAAGIMALALWCFSPVVLAYAQLLTADAGAAALGITAAYFFWKWLGGPTWGRALAAGIVLGLAELTKTTWVLLFGLWPLLFVVFNFEQLSRRAHKLIRQFSQRPKVRGRRAPSLAGGPGGLPNRAASGQSWHAGAKTSDAGRSRRSSVQLAVILTLGIFLINAGYDFEGAGTRLREFAFVSSPLTGKYAEGWSPGNRFAGSWLGTLRVPLPRNYLEGIDLQWHDIELGKPSYLRGRWQERGWWYWYLYALAVKVPLGTWGLFLLTVGVRVAARFKKNPHAGLLPVGHPHPGPLPEGEGGRNPGVPGESVPDRITWRDELVLLAPAVAVLVLVSSQTGFSRYIRYILPAFPFVFVWISSVAAWAWPERNSRQPTKIPHPSPLPEGEGVSPHPRPFPEGEGARNGTESVFYGAMRTVRDWFARNGRGVIVCSLLAWSIGSSLWYAPHWMSYFNELAGGPVGGPKHLIDAQVDWGQDLLYLKKWLDAHPEARPLGFVYFGPINPTLAGVDFFVPPKGIVVGHDRIELARLPDSLMPGWYAVSVNYLYGYDHYIHDPSGSREWVTRPYYSYFRRFEPVAMAGYSIYIYHLTVAEIEEARDRRSEAREE